MTEISFNVLWENYPSEDTPCKKDGEIIFTNQCAIRVGIALAKCGYDVTKLKRAGEPVFCWQHSPQEGHILRAEELAEALNRTKIPGIGKTIKIIPGANFNNRINGKKGIIFLKDYWARGSDTTNRSGDHIDLWNGSRMTSNTSYFRAQWRLPWEWVEWAGWSDFNKSKEVWFWEIT